MQCSIDDAIVALLVDERPKPIGLTTIVDLTSSHNKTWIDKVDNPEWYGSGGNGTNSEPAFIDMKRPNPFWNKPAKAWTIEKVSEFGAFLGAYEQRYNAELNKQAIWDYYNANPLWPNADGIGQGEHVNLFIARHIVTGQLYLKYEPRTIKIDGHPYEAIAKVQYRHVDSKQPLNARELATLAKFKKDKEFGLVAWNTVKIENIHQMRFGGKQYEIKK